jgi:chemotaxis signal transduction protein
MDPGGGLRLVCFELRGQELALPIADVRETLPLLPITRVVLTPACLAGVFSLRGDIVPVIDLCVLLGLPPTETGDDSRIVVIKHEAGTLGIVVDRLRDLRRIDAGASEGAGGEITAVEPTPPNLPAAVAALLAGVVATPTGTVRVLSASAIVGCDQLAALRTHESPSA